MLDIRTLYVISAIMALILAVDMRAMHWYMPGEQSLQHWATGSLWIAAGGLLLALIGIAPDALTVIVGSTLIIAGFCRIHYGAMKLLHQNSAQGWYWPLVVTLFLLLFYFSYVQPNLAVRVFVFCLGLAFILAKIARVFWIYSDQELIRLNRATAVLFLLGALINVIRAVDVRRYIGMTDIMSVASVSLQSAMLYFIIFSVWIAIVIPMTLSVRIQRREALARAKAEANELNLCESADRFSATIEATNDGILAVDDKGDVLFMNQRFRQMWNLPEQITEKTPDSELLTYALCQLVDPQSFMIQVQALYQSEQASEDLLELTDGRFFERHSLPLKIGDRGVGRVWSFHDISERRRAEQDALAAKERLDLAQQFSNMGTWEWRIDTDTLHWSEGIAPLLGYPEGSLEVSNEKYLAVLHPDDLRALIEARNAALDHDVPIHTEQRVSWPDGSEHWLLVQGSLLRDDQGRPLRILGLMQDITGQVHTRQHLRQQNLFQNLVANIASDFLLANASNLNEKLEKTMASLGEFFEVDRCDLLQLSEDNSLLVNVYDWCREGIRSKQPLLESFPVDQAPWYTRKIINDRVVVHIADVESLPPEAAFEKSILIEMGVKSALSVPIQTQERVFGCLGFDSVRTKKSWPDDQIDGLTIVAQVIANAMQRIHFENTLITLKETSDKANQAKSDFLSSMSHELRTPMNAILGFGQLMECDGNLSDEHQEFVQEILKAGHHLLTLINEVLDLSKVESGNLDLSLEPVALSPVLEECLSLVSALAQQRGIQLIVRGLQGVAVRADRTRLKQVVLNLLSNAIKYNRDNGRVSVDTCSVADNRLRLQVTDTGYGIAENRQAELFQPFNRLDAEFSDIEGTGIGLTITRRIVEMMGGAVGVNSQVNVGSTFWIELPLEVSKGNDDEYLANERKAVAADIRAADRATMQTILYIEDNPVNLKLVAHILRRVPGIQLLSAHTSSLGIELAQAHQPSLILLDINLPGMDGYQLMELFKSDTRLQHIPVIAVTANAMPRDIARGKAAGFQGYLTKPLKIDDFYAAIEPLLASQKGIT